MALLEKIRNKPHEQKVRLIWIFSGIAVVLLIVIWIVAAHMQKSVPADTTLFQTLGRGVTDLKDNYNKPIK
jgi:hypothetical protein